MEKKKLSGIIKEPKSVFVYLVLAAVTLLISTIYSSNMFHPTLPHVDSAVFRYVALVMKRGGMMYRDVFDHKGPVIFLLNRLGMLIDYRNGIWIVEILSLYITAVCTYQIAKRFLKPVTALIAAITVLLQLYPFIINGGNYVEEYALPFITGGLLIYVQYFQDKRTSPVKLVICGFCFMGVLLLRPNMIGTWIVFSFAVLIAELEQKSKKWVFYIIWFLAGAALLLVPILLFLKTNNALSDFFKQYIQFNAIYTDNQSGNRIHAIMHFLSMGTVFASLIILVVYILLDKEKDRLARIWLVYILISLPIVALSGREYEHYGIILVPLSILPISLLLRFLFEKALSRKYLYCALLATLIALSYPYIHHNNMLGSVLTTDQCMDGLVANFIKQNTDPNDTIIVSGTRDVIYFLSERLAASKYSYQSPIGEMDPTIYDQTMEDVEKNKPVFLVLHTYEANGTVFIKEMNRRLTEYAEKNSYTKQAEIEPFIIYWKKN